MSEAVQGGWRAEYDAVRGGAGAGLFDLSARGRVEVWGGEAVRFLNGMVTNDVAALAEGAWMRAAFPNPQGRLLALVRVFRRGDRFLFDTEPETYPRLVKDLERFTLAGDFFVRDLTAETTLLSVQGARATEIVAAVLGRDAASTPRGSVRVVTFEGSAVEAARATHTGEDGYDLIAAKESAESLRDALVAAGAVPAGAGALEVLRVEAGVPRYGVDASDANVVLEVVEESEAVSYTKGCYTGQEIIARIHWRGHVAKKLAGLVFEGEGEVPAGARLRDTGDGREVGRVTSSVFSPRSGGRVGLGLVKYDHLAAGTRVGVFEDDAELCAARVEALPLVRGGWHDAAAGGEGEKP